MCIVLHLVPTFLLKRSSTPLNSIREIERYIPTTNEVSNIYKKTKEFESHYGIMS